MVLVALAALLVLTTAATCRKSDGTKVYTGIYVSIGDSIAAGNGSSDPKTTSFVADLARDEGNLETLNAAVAGATTRDVLEKQLPSVLAATAEADLAFITISVGGNDLAGLIPNPACVQDPLPASCPLDDALRSVDANLREIMTTLRAAHPGTPIVLLAYPNFFSGTGHAFEAPAGRVLPRLDDVIRAVAASFPHAGVADAAPAFEGRGPELTHTLDRVFDPHPTDAGHRLIADAFVAALAAVN
jgi:lysophospholipase L1-like esterase